MRLSLAPLALAVLGLQIQPALAAVAPERDVVKAAPSVPALKKLTNPSAAVTRGELPELVRQILADNPEVVIEAAKRYRETMKQQSRQQTKEELAKHEAELFGDTTSPSIGPKNADVTVIEFFDYHCGYCKQMLPTITKLMEDDKKVRVIFRELPILSEDSVTASRAALAVWHIAPEKYFEFHTALLKNSGKYDEAYLSEQAKKIGIEPEKLKAEMDKDSITVQLDDTRKLAEAMGIRGTPAIILPKMVIPGAVPLEDLKEMVSDLHAGKPLKDYDPDAKDDKKPGK